jgi:hypothetical protein
MTDWRALLAGNRPVNLSGTVLRMVESQEQVATNRLVSSLERQSLLEDMLEQTKPPLRTGSEGLHYLLATPFRYPPLRHGSRFGRRSQPSLFYGSTVTATVLTEAAYYRFLFWYGMTDPPAKKIDTQHTLFAAGYRSDQSVRLQSPSFDAYRALLGDPSDHTETQALGTAMREAGIEAFEFVSARDPAQGINVALFTPAAFTGRQPLMQSAWLCELTATQVRFREVHSHATHGFPLAMFLVEGGLPRAG